MCSRTGLRVLASWMFLGLSVGSAAAQTPARVATGQSLVSASGGLSAARSGNGASVGAAFTLALNERVAIETSGTYLDRGAGADALHVGADLIVNLLPSSNRMLPYAALGAGMYRAKFDLDAERFFGAMGTLYPAGTPMIPLQGGRGYGMMGAGYYGPSGWNDHMWDTRNQGAWPGSVYTLQHMPSFYMNRLGPLTVPAGANWGTRTFTDPALTLGGGVRLDLSSHLFVRPDARALVVVGGGDTYTVGMFSFNIGYRF